MSFVKDEDLQIKLTNHGRFIELMMYDKRTKSEVCIGQIIGKQRQNKSGEWIGDKPDEFIAERIRTMVHGLLNDIQAIL